MLLHAASVIRFVNEHLEAYEMNRISVTVYVDHNEVAERHTLQCSCMLIHFFAVGLLQEESFQV